MDISNINYLWISVIEAAKVCCISVFLAFVILCLAPLFLNYHLLYCAIGITFLSPFLAPLVTQWISKKKTSPPDGKAIIITGCDSGFGHLLAQRMDKLGYHIFAGCLFPDGDGATELRRLGTNRLHVISLDVTSNASVQEARTYVEENLRDNVLWAVVNNAGIIAGGEVHWTDMATIQKLFEVNILGVVRVTQAFLPKLKESKGRVVTVTSRAGRFVFPTAVPYCMSKASAIAFCDGLRLEMYKWGIKVISIEPAFYKTALISELPRLTKEMWDKAPQDLKSMYGPNHIEEELDNIRRISKFFSRHPSEVVTDIENALTALHPKYYYTPGNITVEILFWLSNALPKPIADLLSQWVLLGTMPSFKDQL